jgi:hypothetical protein
MLAIWLFMQLILGVFESAGIVQTLEWVLLPYRYQFLTNQAYAQPLSSSKRDRLHCNLLSITPLVPAL